MQSEIQSAGIYTDFAGLAKLKSEATQNADKARREVSQQFEAMFIQSMLKTMREATPGGGLTDSDQVKMYQDMFDKQLSIDLAQKGGIGIAEFMELQLAPTDDNSSDRNTTSSLPDRNLAFASGLWGQPQKLPVETFVRPGDNAETVTSGNNALWDSPESFVHSLMPAARKAASELNTSPEAIIAIAALETGWGKHVIPGRNGNSSYNLFGIKASSGRRDQVSVTTLEFEHGAMQKVKQPFRTYSSASGSVEDFAHFINNNPRYSEALKIADDPEKFIHEIHKAGYATDPNYAEKAVSVLKQIQSMNQDAVAIADNSPQGS